MDATSKWLSYTLCFSSVVISLVGYMNYKVDSLSIFGNSNHVSRAAEALAGGNMIAGLANFDERLFQELVVKNLEVKNSVIAIGSSKTMLLRKRFLASEEIDFFNHSVSGATLEDYISIVGLYELTHDYLPETIILGVDPWVFNKNNGQTRWKTLKKYYAYQQAKFADSQEVNSGGLDYSKWQQLINYDYTVSNLRFLVNQQKNGGKEFYVTETIEVDDLVREADGSINYPYLMRYPNLDEVKASALKYARYPVYGLEDYSSLHNQKLFENFLDYLQSRSVEVTFFLPVYHPITYDLLISDPSYDVIGKVEEYLAELAESKGIEIRGSYNPHKYSFSNSDFLDGMHASEKVTETMFSEGS